MMNMINLFPPGIAEGEAFCNRVIERKQLKDSISTINHTVVMAPRRYGKSSLINCVVKELHVPFVWIDFLSVASKEETTEKILKAAKQLLFDLSPELKKMQLQAKDFVKSLSPELTLGALGQSLTFHLSESSSASIDEILLQLDDYAQRTGKKAVLVFDEFQQISELKDSASVEALIRHAVERSKAITYIFSGSNRHLLLEMFGKSSRPLYRLCQPMSIDRITENEYSSFLNKAANHQWKTDLSEQVLKSIFASTECHPFYVNALCNKLWSSTKPPTLETTRDAWDWYVTTYKSIIVSDIISLALNQKKIISALAEAPVKEPYGGEFCAKTKVSLSSMRQAFDTLLIKDIIFINKNIEFQLLDPAIRYYLLNH